MHLAVHMSGVQPQHVVVGSGCAAPTRQNRSAAAVEPPCLAVALRAGPASPSDGADGGLQYEYDPEAAAAYWARRPLAVASRSAQVGVCAWDVCWGCLWGGADVW